MELLHVEGVVLNALPFKDRDHILTVFTPLGIQKFFIKGTKRIHPLISPLTVGEFIYSASRSDLHRVKDGTVLDQNLKLRDSLENLLAAEKLVSAIVQTQMPGKSALSLYRLFRMFLAALPFSPPEKLCSLFYLKVMKHEGILQLQNPFTYRYGGECYKKEEAPLFAHEMSQEEEDLLQQLANARKLEETLLIAFPQKFSEKIYSLFNQAFPQKG